MIQTGAVVSAGLDWLTLVSAGLPAIAAITAAVIASRAATRARTSEAEAEHIRRLEERVSGHKYDVYRPMLEALNATLNSGRTGKKLSEGELTKIVSSFATWVAVFGSDDSVRAFRNFMQGAYHGAPPAITMRLYADLQMAARKDMGDPTTRVGLHDLVGARITDLYTGTSGLFDALERPFKDVCEEAGWPIPWEDAEPSASNGNV